MSQNINDIKKIIDKIKIINHNIELKGITKLNDKENYFWSNHSDIMNKYPFLVHQLCSGSDNSMLDEMLKQIESINKGKTNTKDADVKIGESLADKYLK
jgi:hypothetical protein